MDFGYNFQASGFQRKAEADLWTLWLNLVNASKGSRSMTEREEQNLIKAARAGDNQAFGRLFTSHQPTIQDYLADRVRDREDGEDLAQEVFIAALTHLDRFRGDCPFSQWLFRIALNRLKNYYRALKAREGQLYPLDGSLEDPPLDLQQK